MQVQDRKTFTVEQREKFEMFNGEKFEMFRAPNEHFDQQIFLRQFVNRESIVLLTEMVVSQNQHLLTKQEKHHNAFTSIFKIVKCENIKCLKTLTRHKYLVNI